MVRKVAILVACAIAVGGASTAMYMRSLVRTNSPYPGKPIHPITEAMRTESARASRNPAPMFALKDHSSRTIRLEELLKAGPALLIFTIHDCPCTIDAQPLFNALANYYGKKVSFVGIGHDSPLDVSNFIVNMSVPYPVLIDPDRKVIQSFGAVNSVYTALVGTDGNIARLWPGYDKKMVMEINDEIAKTAGIAPMKLDLAHVPAEPTSGCAL